MKTTVKSATIIFLTLVAVQAFSQSEAQWHLDQGKAIARKSMFMPGKSSAEIYKEMNRWLVKYFDNPEDNIKARIDGEYLKGTGYYNSIFGNRESADFQYMFIFDVEDGKVTMTLTNGLIIYTYSSATGELDKNVRVEEFLQSGRRTKRGTRHAEEIMMSLNAFSSSLLGSFEKSMVQANPGL